MAQKKDNLFIASKDAERQQHWNRYNPRDAVSPPQHVLCDQQVLCDLLFDEQFIIKIIDSVANGELVRIPKGTWTLTNDAIPTKFLNLPSY